MDQPHLIASPTSALAEVLTDPALWRLVTSFQRGLPIPLYKFWLAHEPTIADSQDRDLIVNGRFRLTKLLVEHGTLHQLETMSQLVFHDRVWRRAMELMMIRSVISDAIRFHRADMLEWAITRHDSQLQRRRQTHTLWWEEAIDSYRDGDLQVLDVLRMRAPLAPTKLKRFLQKPQDVPFMQWLDQHFPRAWEPWVIQLAATEGNVELVSYLLEHHPTLEYPPYTFEGAYACRHWPVVRCIMEKKPMMVRGPYVDRMIWDGEPEAMELLREMRGIQHHIRESTENCIRNGQLDLVQRIVSESLLSKDTTFSIDDAASGGKLDVIKFLAEKGLATATTEAMDSAAERAHWDVVQYLHENRSEGCTTRAMDTAAAQGKIDFIKLFHTERSEGCTIRAMDEAATQGCLDIVQFLHDHRSEGCCAQIMEHAAFGGHVHVVQFMHENRSEGCTTQAMDFAASQGHLRVVQYLHAHRTEGCTVAAVRHSLQNGHLQVVRFLFQHYRSLFGPEQLHDLLLHGAFEIWTALRDEYPEQANAVVEPVLFEAGKQAELATIQFVVATLGRRDIAYVAMDGAAKYGYNKHSQLLRAVFAIAGADSVHLSAVRNATEEEFYSDPFNLQFLISVCCEDGARELAIELLRVRWQEIGRTWLAGPQAAIEAWQPVENEFENAPMHLLLKDARCPSWAVRSAEMGLGWIRFGLLHDPFWRFQRPVPWTILAINRGDRVLVEMLRDLHERYPEASQEPEFSLEGARAAAIRNNNLPLLQWLLDNVGLPVEPTLLDEALYYHQYEIAEWLANHCPEGCQELDWETKPYVPWMGACSLDQELVDWIESDVTVRSFVDFGGLASHAAAEGKLELLKQLHASHPERVLARGDLLTRAQDKDHADVVAFLTTIRNAAPQ